MSFRSVVVLSIVIPSLACGGGGETARTDTATTATPPASTPAVAAGPDGATEYIVCQTCHQANGAGLPATYPPLAGSEIVTGDPSMPIAIILHGLQGEITVGGQKFNNVMAPWSQLSDAQIAAILTYERSSWGNTASAVTAEQVAAVRAATSSRAGAWTMAELKQAKLQ